MIKNLSRSILSGVGWEGREGERGRVGKRS